MRLMCFLFAPLAVPPRRWALIFLTPALAAGALVMTLLSPARAADASLDDARMLVERISRDGLSKILVVDTSIDRKIDRFRALFLSRFDMRSVSRFILGRAWRDTAKAERDRFVALFGDLNVYTWARRFKHYDGQTLVVGAAAPDGAKGAIVDSKILDEAGEGAPIAVQWRLRKRGGVWKLVDLVIEGVSMAITYRAEYQSLLADRDVDVKVLNDLIEQQIESAKALLSSSPP